MRWTPLAALLLLAGTYSLAQAQSPSPGAAEFFEKEVRPLLVERCHSCHGDAKTKGGLKLTSRAGVLKGGDSGPAVVAGKPDEGLLIQAVRYHNELKMPPKGKLPDRELAVLARWVQMGLPWPEAKAEAVKTVRSFYISEEQRKFWAFQPVKAVTPPATQDAAWPGSDVDRFILVALEAKGLRPAKPADKRTLLRRATFDLIGLPPTPEEIEAFLADDSSGAFARVVDRLLASPHYGERWGRHWLDVVRYADSFDARGLGGEGDIADAWRYRDWIVEAFNRDLPYNQFIMDQIAGDLAEPQKPGFSEKPGFFHADGIVATGLLAIGNWGGGDADKEKLLTDIVDDQIDVVGRAFLGLTLACARCHDHKFDPISTEDYYGLAGIFFSTHILPNVGPKTGGPPMLRIPLLSPAEKAWHEQDSQRLAKLDNQLAAARAQQAQLLARGLLPEPARLALAAPVPADQMARVWQDLAQVSSALAVLKKSTPPIPYANGAQEGGVPGSPHAGVHDVPVHVRGRYDRLGDLVPRRLPRVLAGDNQPPLTQGSGRRQLAEWLARLDHPLTARVAVNRIWQGHFGEGLVRTPSNFGKLGERPTHPELLDYLARRFVESGWSVKAMHRLILLSATYQQSSTPSAEALQLDPDNRLFGRMNRRRLEAEAVRDSLLAVAGRLDRRRGGPATRDFNDPRRTLYQMTIRSDRSGFGPLFDAADPTAPAEKRTVSTVAPQALFLMNHPFVMEQTQALAKRLLSLADSDRQRIDKTYELLYARRPSEEEAALGIQLLSRNGPSPLAWQEYCQVLLCANELIFVD